VPAASGAGGGAPAPATPRDRSLRGAPRQIRIIGGDWKRTPLPVVNADGLRPTPDRVRETLFNWLGQRLDGLRCLDLFAGSGALGFEAASRGAARVLMVERDARAVHQLRANQARLAATAVEIVEADAVRLAARLPALGFDVIFVDPPFGSDLLGRTLPLVVPLLAADGVVYIEAGASLLPRAARHAKAASSVLPGSDADGPVTAHDPAADVGIDLDGWTVVRYGNAGAVHYHLLQRENRE
jgi:16S rRNA (guanine(966)-N(2))-methyltransferase RsmD